jgi:hypothetical protein
MTVPALRDVDAKIDMIFLTQLKPQPTANAGKKSLFPKHLTFSWDDFTDTSKRD